MLVVVVDGGAVEAGQGGGVVAGAGGEGENSAGGGADSDNATNDGAGSHTGLEGVPGGLLHGGFNGEGNVTALGIAAGEEVHNAVIEKFVVFTGENGVLEVFHAGAGIEAEVSGDGRPHFRILVVDAVVLVGFWV